MKLSKRLQQEREFVERSLGDREICRDCHATLSTFADACTAGLQDPCPGYLAIEQARLAAKKRGGMTKAERFDQDLDAYMTRCCNASMRRHALAVGMKRFQAEPDHWCGDCGQHWVRMTEAPWWKRAET